jgi:hypothetical protein
MVELTLACLAIVVSAAPQGIGSAELSPAPQPFYRIADSWDEVVIRAQSNDSPYYDELPPASGGSLPQYPYTPSDPGYAVPGTTVPGNPPTFGDPNAASGYGSPVGPVPYDPFLGQAAPPGSAPANGTYQYGVNGPQPYRFGPQPRMDFGYIAPANTGSGYGKLEAFELDADMPIAKPLSNGDVFTFTPQFDMRLFNGPNSPPGRPGFPNDLYRFGWDFSYAWKDPVGAWSGELAFNPSINTDFEKGLTIDAVNWDGRGIAFFQASPTLTVALGALYWDRVHDRVLPYAGVIWLPNDRWELRLIFPDARISYFAGYMWGKPTWVYARAEYDVEAYQVEVPPGQRNQLEMSDWRFLLGARKEQGWGQTFLEAGWVFNRKVRYAQATAPGFNIGDAFIVRGGLRF